MPVDQLQKTYSRLREAVADRSGAGILPSATTLAAGAASLPQDGSPDFLAGRGAEATMDHLLRDVVPALNSQSLSGRYYGFVTGGSLPVAEAADNIVSALDQNVQVHLPDQSLSTAVEDAALRMLVALLELGPAENWAGRTLTTGATASNVLGLACGREFVVGSRLPGGAAAISKKGLLAACAAARVKQIQILTSTAHSSVSKAASIVGLGHDAVRELPASDDEPWLLDLDAVERELARDDGVASIIVVGAGEVNTGRFATNALSMPKIRGLADRYGAWVHVDGAFGIFARALPQSDEFLNLRAQAAGLELADSIAADGHKLLNVPYDSGLFFCRHPSVLSQTCANPNAAYLSPTSSGALVPSPLNVGLENSRRFRALPVYAVLLSEGRDGVAKMLARMVRLARRIALFVRDSDDYEWLPDSDAPIESTHVVVLFRAGEPRRNEGLVARINQTGKMYVSGTKWRGGDACRIAVGSWRVDVDGDFEVVKEVLESLARG